MAVGLAAKPSEDARIAEAHLKAAESSRGPGKSRRRGAMLIKTLEARHLTARSSLIRNEEAVVSGTTSNVLAKHGAVRDRLVGNLWRQ